jgi:hypothetical protein
MSVVTALRDRKARISNDHFRQGASQTPVWESTLFVIDLSPALTMAQSAGHGWIVARILALS